MSPTESLQRQKVNRRIWLFLAVLLAVRLLLLAVAPHMDPSEARYAEISRKMVETGNWVTPQFDYGVPFWAKPPLSMWLSAVGIQLFGANEFGSRIFIFAAGLGVLWLVARLATSERDRTTGLVAALILMAMPLFFYCSAAVMTDLPLLLGVTLTLVGFRLALRERSKAWGYGFFLGLALGLLAKGPLVLVITGPPIAGWIIVTGRWKQTWKDIPWFTGCLMMLAISVPWYVLAEMRTPGFLDYFLVGEHWKRFTEKGWNGDLYGHAHPIAPGMILAFTLLGTFPWCLGVFAAPLRRWRGFGGWLRKDDGAALYLLLWALWPIVFFIPARNIILTYPLPVLPAIAVLLAILATPRLLETRAKRSFHTFHPAMVIVSGCMVLAYLLTSTVLPKFSPKTSELELVRRYQHDKRDGDQLVYFRNRRYSAEFYLAGKVANTEESNEVARRLVDPGRLFVACSRRSMSKLPEEIRRSFSVLGSWKNQFLYVERQHPPSVTPVGVGANSHPKNP